MEVWVRSFRTSAKMFRLAARSSLTRALLAAPASSGAAAVATKTGPLYAAAIVDSTTVVRREFAAEAAPKSKLPPPLPLYGLEGRYATALYYAAGAKEKLATIEQELANIGEMIGTDAEFTNFLKDPSIARASKAVILKEVLTKLKASTDTVQFFVTLAENGRLPETGKIITAFQEITRNYRGEVKATITSAEPLSDSETAAAKKALAKLVEQGKTVLVDVKVDPSIIGGLIVDVGDKYIDLSLKTRVKQLENIIKTSL